MDPVNNDSTSKLLSAIESNNVEEVEMILLRGVNVNDTIVSGGTVLHVAVKHKDTRCLPLLLEHGADPNIKNKDQDTPLHIAVDCENVDAVRLLIGYGADLEETDISEDTVLERASFKGHIPTIKELLKAGALVSGTTLLYYAAVRGDEDLLLEIVQHCENTGIACNINERKKDRTTPFYVAAGNGLKNSIELLLKHGADPNIGNDNYFSGATYSLPLHAAVSSGDFECVKMLLPPVTVIDLLNKCLLSPFYYAMKIDEDKGIEMCKLLLQAGADVNKIHDIEHYLEYIFPVCCKILFDYLEVFNDGVHGTVLCLLTLLEESRLEIAPILIDAGARIDPISKNELPVLVAALQMVGDDVSLPQLLIERGASVNIYIDRFVGNVAVLCTRGNFPALEFILNAGAEVDSLFEYIDYDDDDDDDDDDTDDPATHRISMFKILAGMSEKSDVSKIVLKILDYSVNVNWTSDLNECLDDDDENKEKIIDIIESPRSLQHLCRAAVRRTISPKNLISPSLRNLLPLPSILIDYVLHKPIGS